MWTMMRRVMTAGAKSFARSGLVSIATVLIMTVTLIILGLLMFLSALLTHTLTAIEDKVDVNVYFTTTAPESQILALKDRIAQLPDVASVTYTSSDEALVQFKERHTGDTLTLQALDELGTNPLGASLAIKAHDPSQYAGIVDFLSSGSGVTSDQGSIIDRVNYFQNKTVIDRLTGVIKTTEQAGAAIVALFVIASIIIALSTIRLAIYTARDEISVMRLVGASNMYIRGPFIVAGIIAGVLAALIALLLFYPAAWYAGSSLSAWLGGFNVFTYYVSHFPLIAGALIGSGILLGGVASWLGVRRYLKV